MTLKIKVKCFQKKVGYEKEKWTLYEKDMKEDVGFAYMDVTDRDSDDSISDTSNDAMQ